MYESWKSKKATRPPTRLILHGVRRCLLLPAIVSIVALYFPRIAGLCCSETNVSQPVPIQSCVGPFATHHDHERMLDIASIMSSESLNPNSLTHQELPDSRDLYLFEGAGDNRLQACRRASVDPPMTLHQIIGRLTSTAWNGLFNILLEASVSLRPLEPFLTGLLYFIELYEVHRSHISLARVRI